MRFVLSLLLFFFISPAFASVSVSVNGSSYTIPQTNEKGWGTSVTSWIQAMSLYTLQPSGGTFTLTAEVDTGATYGFKVPYIKTQTATPATAGVLRLAKTDTIGWKNNAGGGNLLLGIDSSDNLTFNSVIIPTGTTGSFQDSTFFVYDNGDATKKIAFQASGITTATTRTITMADANVDLADVSGATSANTNSKIVKRDGSGNFSAGTISAALTGNVTGNVTGNADTATALAANPSDCSANQFATTIAANGNLTCAQPTVSNITALASHSRALVSDSSGIISEATTTSTEIGYVNGVTSAIQTQLNAITSAASTSYDVINCTLTATVSANALTVALKTQAGSDPSGGSPCKIGFRNATIATGDYSQVSATAATSVVASSGSTLGTTSATANYVYVYAINNGGTIELGLSNRNFDQLNIQSSTTEGGAGAADSGTVLYSTTGRSNKAIRLIGRILSTQATAGTWASAVTSIDLISSIDYIEPSRQYTCALSGPAGWSTTFCFAVPYETIDGTWRLRFNFQGTYTSAASATITIGGVTFATPRQSVFCTDNSGGSAIANTFATASGSTISVDFASNNTDTVCSGDVALTSKPTFAR